MKKLMVTLSMLILTLTLTSCGLLGANNGSAKIKTNVNIIDPYGNKLFVEGTINGYKIEADKDGVYVASKIESITSYKFSEDLKLFTVKSIDVNPGKEVNIVLERNVQNGVKLLRTSDGKLVFYAFGLKDTPYFQVWLRDKLSTFAVIDLNKDQTLLAGNWLIGVGKGRGNDGPVQDRDEIVVRLNIPATKAPEVVKFEELK
ncbi:MAG: lipoprotein [Fervidobacterium sp.]